MHIDLRELPKRTSNYNLYLIGAVLSFALSFWVLIYRQPINVDGILYIYTAQAFLAHGLMGAFHSYSWPYYSILIALTHRISSLNLEYSARLLDAVLAAFMVVNFIALVKEMGGNRRIQCWALLIILIYPFFNHLRDNILRDFGYNAFSLLSLTYFIRYLREYKWSQAIIWAASTLIAVLFRGEGLIILFAAPFGVFLKTDISFWQRIVYFLRAHTLNFMGLFIIIIWLLLHPQFSVISRLGNIEIFHYLFGGLSLINIYFSDKVISLQQALTTVNLQISPSLLLYTSMPIVFIQTLIATTGLSYLILACLAIYYHLLPKGNAVRIGWGSYIFLNLIITWGFLAADFFLATRYLLQLSLFILLVIPFSLEFIYENWRNNSSRFVGKKWFFPVVCIFLLVLTIDAIGHFGVSKSYVIDAGQWVKNNTTPQSLFYTNDAQVAYYSNRPGTVYPDDFINIQDPLLNLIHKNLRNYKYAAISVPYTLSKEIPTIEGEMTFHPSIIFKNKRGDAIYIFKMPDWSQIPYQARKL